MPLLRQVVERWWLCCRKQPQIKTKILAYKLNEIKTEYYRFASFLLQNQKLKGYEPHTISNRREVTSHLKTKLTRKLYAYKHVLENYYQVNWIMAFNKLRLDNSSIHINFKFCKWRNQLGEFGYSMAYVFYYFFSLYFSYENIFIQNRMDY